MHRDDDKLVADLLITSADGIRLVESHTMREVSCGYDATPIDEGGGYGHQVGIVGNHVALVQKGRCGSACKIRDSVMTTNLKTILRRVFKDGDEEKFNEALDDLKIEKVEEVEKVDELVALGFNEETALHILDGTSGWWGAGFAPFELSNNNAKIKDTEAKIKRHAAMASKEDEVHTAPWGTLRIDYSDERYRFVFDGKPEQDVIDMLKQNAFKWSPANKAWQRQITPSARYAVDRIVEYLNTK
jgi:hypothetical protein